MGQKRNRARAKIRRARKAADAADSLCQELVQGLRSLNASLEAELGRARREIVKLTAASRENSPFNTAVRKLAGVNPYENRTYAISVSLNRLAFRLALDQSSNGQWREIEYLIENLLRELNQKLRQELREAFGAECRGC